MLGNLFCIDLRRAVCSRAFLLTVLAMVFVELLSAGPILSIPEFGVTEILDNLFAGTDSASLLFMLFPLFPGALTYAKDVQERSVNFWLIRAEVKAYMASKYLAACASALLALETSFVLFCLPWDMACAIRWLTRWENVWPVICRCCRMVMCRDIWYFIRWTGA